MFFLHWISVEIKLIYYPMFYNFKLLSVLRNEGIEIRPHKLFSLDEVKL